MKIHVISDLHLDTYHSGQRTEFFRRLREMRLRNPADVLVVAGDVCSQAAHKDFAKKVLTELCSMYRKVLYVFGNHEYWGHDFPTINAMVDRWRTDPNLANLEVLTDGDTMDVEGQTYLGGTMWYPQPDDEDAWTKNMYPDFRAVRDFEPEVYHCHGRFLTALEHALEPGDPRLDPINGLVVISHMGPLEDSIDAQFAGYETNRFFCPDISHHLKGPNLPKLWIHGHTHCAFDYKWRGMRVYCNPHGYPNEGANRNFWDRIAIDI